MATAVFDRISIGLAIFRMNEIYEVLAVEVILAKAQRFKPSCISFKDLAAGTQNTEQIDCVREKAFKCTAFDGFNGGACHENAR